MDFFKTFGQVVSKVKDAVKNFNDVDSELKKELARCESSADEGYKLASDNYDEIERTLLDAKKRIADANAEQNQVGRIKNTELIKEQESELKNLEQKIDVIGKKLSTMHESQKDFSIVVYGRTMAGKSTLMEILTRGNGESIGKGSQRTTRDVRSYLWNGLKITDVPGICAFDGKEDERLAMEAAKSADLILFLITNDAPQADEAACLAQLKSFGKPVLGLINVKSEFNLDSPDWDLDLEDLQTKLSDTSTIDSIINQFKSFDKKHNQDWSDIKFVSTHLLSAYQAHPCRGNNSQVYEASKFAQVEQFIFEKIKNDGRFLRVKTFIDAVAVPMNTIFLRVYKHSANALSESDIWFDKRRELDNWRKEFLDRTQKKLDGLYTELSDQLKREIDNFVDNNYENENAGQLWAQRLKHLGLDTRYRNLLEQLAKECERKRRELSDELTQDIKFTFQSGVNVNVGEVDSTTPWGEFAGGFLGGAGAIAGIAFPPIGIAIGVVGLLTGIFSESREEKIRKNKQKLHDAVTQPSFEILGKIHDKAIEILNTEVLNKGVDEFMELLANYQFMLARLGKSQAELASRLSNHYRKLNGKLLDKAISYTKAGSYSANESPIRLPGKYLAILSKDYKLNKDALTSILGEKFIVLRPKLEFGDNVKLIMHCNYDVDWYALEFLSDNDKENEDKLTYALIPKEKINADTFNMAQQYAGIPIIMR